MRRDKVAAILRAHRCSAYVSPEKNGCVIVAEAMSDTHATGAIAAIARILSTGPRAIVLAIGNVDDDDLFLGLYKAGEELCKYSNYADPDDGTRRLAAERICTSLDMPQAIDAVTTILSGQYTFAIERHTALVDALQLSDFAISFGYRYVERGELPTSLKIIGIKYD